MTEAYRRANPQTDQVAPKNGTIAKVKIVAGKPGAFRIELARAIVGKKKAKLVAVGRVIHYQGQGQAQAQAPKTTARPTRWRRSR